MGAVGAASVFAASAADAQSYAPAILLVTATAAIVELSLGSLALLWLRPDKLLRATGPR